MTKEQLKQMVLDYRAENRISIKQFCKHSGVSYSVIVAVENEKADKLRNITLTKIIKAVQRPFDIGE